MFEVSKMTNKSFDMFKASKMTTKNFDMFKASKMTTKTFDLFKVSKGRSSHLRSSHHRSKVLKKCINKKYNHSTYTKITIVKKKKKNCIKYIIMVKITENKLRVIAKNKGIKDHLNMSRENLLSTLDKLDCITKNLSKDRLNKITKMENLSLNEL